MSFHGSAQASEEMKKIIAQELAEGRVVGMIGASPVGSGRRVLVISGVSSPSDVPRERVCVITRSGIRTAEDGLVADLLPQENETPGKGLGASGDGEVEGHGNSDDPHGRERCP